MKKYVLILISVIMISSKAQAMEIKEPKVDALGAIIMDANTGRVLWGKNENEPLANASTTKIMTAIVALEKGNLNDTVKVSSKAANAPKVKMSLSTNEEIKLEYLLYALLLQSSNDAAVAIAEHIGGDVESFCKLMTDRGKELGAKNTLFETPNGLDKGEHHSTAYDMALISKHALSIPKFIEISNTKSVSVDSNKRHYSITNKNRLLNEFSGANGIKTGFTGKAGHCFVGAAKRGDMQLITVALGSGWGDKGKEQKWVDTKEMLNYGFDNYKYETVVEKGKEVASVNIERSKTPNVNLYLQDGLLLPLNSEEKNSVKLKIDAPESIKAPIKANEKLGEAKVYVCDELIGEIDLLTTAGATRHDLKTSLEKVINVWIELGTNSNVDTLLPEF
jgi:serine-type D-Ala-D-Ala carboxypeptidase (penicillin-binding protein 5/6)